MYVHVPDFVEILYALPLPPSDTAREALLHKSGAVGSADWTFTTQAPTWW